MVNLNATDPSRPSEGYPVFRGFPYTGNFRLRIREDNSCSHVNQTDKHNAVLGEPVACARASGYEAVREPYTALGGALCNVRTGTPCCIE